MIVCALGLPSAFATYGFNLVHRLAGALDPDVMFVAGCTPDQFKEPISQRGKRAVILCSDNLDVRIMDSLIRIGVPIVVFAENYDDCVGFTMAARETDLRTAIQIYAQSAACLAPYIEAGSLTMLQRPAGAMSLEALILEVCDACRFTIEPDALRRVMESLAPSANAAASETVESQLALHVPQTRPIGAYADVMSSEDHRLVTDALDSYATLLDGEIPAFRWPTRMFRDSFRTEEAIEGPVDLTGPARYLMFGPLLHLPPGRWRASIVFRVDDNLSGNTLMSDVVADNQICNTGEGVLPPSGVFSFEIDFVVRDPRLPVAVRLATRSGAIEGTLELLSAEVRELADDEEFITRSVS